MVLLAWVFFRSPSLAVAADYLHRMLSYATGTRFVSPYIVCAIGAVVVTHLLLPKDFDWLTDAPKRLLPVRAFAYGTLLFLLVCFGATDATPFIYFQF